MNCLLLFGVGLAGIDCLLLSCGVGLLLIVVRFTFGLLLVWLSWGGKRCVGVCLVLLRFGGGFYGDVFGCCLIC